MEKREGHKRAGGKWKPGLLGVRAAGGGRVEETKKRRPAVTLEAGVSDQKPCGAPPQLDGWWKGGRKRAARLVFESKRGFLPVPPQTMFFPGPARGRAPSTKLKKRWAFFIS